jgi:hypothetical protein
VLIRTPLRAENNTASAFTAVLCMPFVCRWSRQTAASSAPAIERAIWPSTDTMANDTQVTIVITWVFTWLAEALMTLRLLMRKFRKQRFDISDYLTIAAMAFLIVRLGLVHVVLVWGTNNISAAYRQSNVFPDQEIWQREVGSKLTLASRAVYAT